MGEPLKGTVTSLSSVFAPEDAQKASLRVQEAIIERQKELDQLQAFHNENTTLVNLIKKLPDQLHHDIMVPFGKAAFFPGRLIHTNEFLVLLGEGYFAERTSKQTIEILKRRGKELESQIETLKALMKDLKFEASFFDETATEAAEGIVEIREDYVEEASNDDKAITGEEEYARILSRIDELEKEELESDIVEVCEEEDEADLSHLISSTSLEPEVTSSKEEKKNEHSISERSLQNHTQQDQAKQFKPKESLDFPFSTDSNTSSHIKFPTSSGSKAPPSLIEQNKLKETSHHTPVLMNEVSSSTSAANSSNFSSKASVVAPVAKEVSNFGLSTGTDRSMAFTGSIVEHTHNIEKNQKGQTPAPASKPVSRFKLQRK